MRCLYCGKELALLKRWTGGGEFCSDAHRQQYQEEYNQLALTRLLQAKPPGASAKTDAKPDAKGPAPREEAKPAREEAKPVREEVRPVREDAKPVREPAPPVEKRSAPAKPGPLAPPLAPPPAAKEPPPIAARAAKPQPEPAVAVAPEPEPVVAVKREPEPEPEPEIEIPQVAIAAAEPEPVVEEEPDPAPMAGFFFELPVPVLAEAMAMAQSANGFECRVAPAMPAADFEEQAIELAVAGPVPAGPRSRIADYTAAPADRKLDIREFVRAAPLVEVDLGAAGAYELPDMIEEPMELLIFPRPPQGSPPLWDEGPRSFAFETDLGILARVAFRTTGVQNNEESSDPLEELTAAEGTQFPAVAAKIEAPVSARASEPAVRIEQPAEKQAVEPNRIDKPIAVRIKGPDPLPIERIELEPEKIEAKVEPKVELKPEESKESVPSLVTKPLPVTLHGLAAGRGKPVQVFTAVAAGVDVQIPRSNALPLRPVMTLGPALARAPIANKTADKPAEKPAEQNRPERTVVLKADPKKNPQGRPDPRFANGKGRKDAKPEADKKEVEKKEVEKPEIEKAKEPAVAAATVKTTPEKTVEKPVEKPAEKLTEKPADKAAKVDEKAAQKSAPKADPLPAPLAAPYDIGIPSLNLDTGSSFWARLPVAGKAGLALTVVVAIVGAIYAFKGSGGSTAAASGQIVEAPAITGGEAGWVTDWGSEPGVRKLHDIYVMRSTLTMSDYRLEFQEQMENRALGWLYRAQDGKNYYVTRLELVKPGLNPTVALVRYAVVNGEEQPHTQIPLDLPVHLDTVYKVRFDAVANHFTTWVQDKQVDEWTDERFKVGGVGFYNERGAPAVSMRVAPLVFKK